MKYYILTVSDNLVDIGSFPQVVNTNDNVFGSPFSTIKVNYGEIPEEIPFLELKFEKNAKKTDFLNTYNPSFGLLVSEKIKKIILNFKLTNNKFYPICLLGNSSYIKNYYWFNFYDDVFQYIDMEESKFSMKRRNVIEKFIFKSKDFYLNKKQETFIDFDSALTIEKIYFLDNFPKYDLFEFENYTFISELLLKSLIENNVIGYEAKESKIEIIL